MVGPYNNPAVHRRRVPRLLTALCLAVSLAPLSGCKPGPPTLVELQGVEALQARFNRDAGKTRVVLLLSPT
jgi:hypothetical protein